MRIDVRERILAVRAMKQEPGEVSREHIVVALAFAADPSALVRSDAYELLRRMGGTRARTALRAAVLGEPWWVGRCEAVEQLALLRCRADVPLFFDVVAADPSLPVRSYAIGAIGDLGRSSDGTRLLTLARRWRSRRLRAMAGLAAARLDTPFALDWTLARLLELTAQDDIDAVANELQVARNRPYWKGLRQGLEQIALRRGLQQRWFAR